MRLKAPEELPTSKGRINWFIDQLKKTTHPDIAIRASWPSRAPDTMASLSAIRENGIDVWLCDNPSLKPTAFEVVLKRDLGVKFKGAKTFIQESKPLLLKFYEQADRAVLRTPWPA